MLAITGITGQVGGEVARNLPAGGKQVRGVAGSRKGTVVLEAVMKKLIERSA